MGALCPLQRLRCYEHNVPTAALASRCCEHIFRSLHLPKWPWRSCAIAATTGHCHAALPAAAGGAKSAPGPAIAQTTPSSVLPTLLQQQPTGAQRSVSCADTCVPAAAMVRAFRARAVADRAALCGNGTPERSTSRTSTTGSCCSKKQHSSSNSSSLNGGAADIGLPQLRRRLLQAVTTLKNGVVTKAAAAAAMLAATMAVAATAAAVVLPTLVQSASSCGTRRRSARLLGSHPPCAATLPHICARTRAWRCGPGKHAHSSSRTRLQPAHEPLLSALRGQWPLVHLLFWM